MRLALLISLSLTLALSGCSTVKLAYNNAPEFSYWWLDGYLDFNEPQSLKVRADLATLLAWHRQSELPAYVSTLEKLQRMVPAQVTPEQVCALYAELKPRFQTLLDQAAPAIISLAPTLGPEQLEHLARKFDKRNLKWREEWQDGSPAERSARRLKQLVERGEMLYVRLDEPQLAVLRASAAASAFDASLTYREAVRRQQDALQTLHILQTGSLTEMRAKTEVRALIDRAMNSPHAAYRNYREKMTQASCQAFAMLHNSTTPAQRLKVMETLQDYETDVRILMTQAR